jgi:hypothetical protein
MLAFAADNGAGAWTSGGGPDREDVGLKWQAAIALRVLRRWTADVKQRQVGCERADDRYEGLSIVGSGDERSGSNHRPNAINTNTPRSAQHMVLWCDVRCIVAPYSGSATLAYPWNRILSMPQVSIDQHGKQ